MGRRVDNQMLDPMCHVPYVFMPYYLKLVAWPHLTLAKARKCLVEGQFGIFDLIIILDFS